MTSIDEKIRLLNKLIDKSSSVIVEDSSDPDFKVWRNLVERNFIKIFGKGSAEYEHFSSLAFYYTGPMTFSIGSYDSYESDNLRNFREDFKILISSINSYIEELEEQHDPKIKIDNKTQPLCTEST